MFGIGDCGSEITITQEANYNIIDKNTLININNDINKLIVNSVVKTAKQCGGSISLDQAQKAKNIHSKGKVKIVFGLQSQKSILDFSCVQTDTVRSNIANDLVKNFMASLESSTKSSILSQMDSKATQETSTGTVIPGFTGSTQQDISQEQKLNFNSTKSVYRNIQNTLQNIVEQNITTENISGCLASIKQSQLNELEDISADDDVDLSTLGQEQSANLVANCVQTSEMSSQILNAFTDIYNIKAKDFQTNEIIDTKSALASQKAETKGIISELTDGIKNIISAPFIVIGIIVIIIVIIVTAAKIAFNSSSNTTQVTTGGFYNIIPADDMALLSIFKQLK